MEMGVPVKKEKEAFQKGQKPLNNVEIFNIFISLIF